MIGTSGKSAYAINIGGNKVPAQSQGGWEDVLPGAGGLIGSLFQPEGLVPGAVTSGAGGGIGETARQAIRGLTGRGFDAGQIVKSAGEQAAYGAIPGGQEMKALPVVGRFAENSLGRTALRAGTGLVAGTGAQTIANIGSQTPQTPAVGSGALVGAINAVSPLGGKVLNVLPKSLKTMGNVMTSSATNVVERGKQPLLDSVQRLFGKEAVGTSLEGSFIKPDVAKVIKDFNIPVPQMGGDISVFEPALNRASQAVEDKLQPILKDPIYAIKAGDIQDVLTKNQGTFFGKDRKAMQSFPLVVQKLFDKLEKTKVNLSDLNDAKRELGAIAGWNTPNPTPLEKFAQKSYKQLGDLIDNQLATVDKTEYKSLVNQHKILSKARDAYQKTVSGSGALPTSMTFSPDLARESAQGQGLSGGRFAELGARAIPLTAATLANAIPGTPEWLKAIADLGAVGSAAYETARFAPHLNPQKALQVAGKLQNIPQAGDNFTRALQQLGVRIPGLGQ